MPVAWSGSNYTVASNKRRPAYRLSDFLSAAPIALQEKQLCGVLHLDKKRASGAWNHWIRALKKDRPVAEYEGSTLCQTG